MNDQEEQEWGESEVSFTGAAVDAARRLGERLGDDKVAGPWSVVELEVVLGHHSPSHIEVYRVKIGRGSGG